MKRRLVDFNQQRLGNPLVMRRAGNLGFEYAALETIGLKSGLPRQIPIGDGQSEDGKTFWIVAQHGRDASYVQNIEVNPRVRLRYNGKWHTGTAHLMPGDDPVKRLKLAYVDSTASMVKRFGTSLLTVRVDVDP